MKIVLGTRAACVAAIAIVLLLVLSQVEQSAEFGTLARSNGGSRSIAPLRPAHPAKPKVGVRAPEPLPEIEAVGDLARTGVGPMLAMADADGSRHRAIQLTHAGPARGEPLALGLDLPYARVRPAFDLAVQLEIAMEARVSSGAIGAERSPDAMARFWATKSGHLPGWLTNAGSGVARPRVPVGDVLTALAEIRKTFRSWPQLRALLRAESSLADGLRHFGSNLFVRAADPRPGALEWQSGIRMPAWADPKSGASAGVPSDPVPGQQERLGAFVGWDFEDRPIVFSGGTSDRDRVRKWVAGIEAVTATAKPDLSRGCVEARFAPSGGIRSVRNVKTGALAREGPLRGLYQARVNSGSIREFLSDGQVELKALPNGALALTMTLSTDEYIARVVDRAGVAASAEAAKSVAVLARFEVGQLPVDRRGCHLTHSDGESLRFSLSPSSAAARRFVAWTSGLGLILPADVRDRSLGYGTVGIGPSALKLATRGWYFDEILTALGPGVQIVPKVPGLRPLRVSASQN